MPFTLATWNINSVRLRAELVARLMRELVDDSTITEAEFLTSVLDSGILIYLSSTWLREVYRIVLSKDLFEGTQVASPIVHLCSGWSHLFSASSLQIQISRHRRVRTD